MVKILRLTVPLIVFIVFFCGCTEKQELEDVSLKTGTYIIENADSAIPYLKLSEDNQFLFQYSVLSSTTPAGTYVIKDDLLYLNGDSDAGEKQTFVFRIESEKLVYSEVDSYPLPDFAKDNIHDGVVFLLSAEYTDLEKK